MVLRAMGGRRGRTERGRNSGAQSALHAENVASTHWKNGAVHVGPHSGGSGVAARTAPPKARESASTIRILKGYMILSKKRTICEPRA